MSWKLRHISPRLNSRLMGKVILVMGLIPYNNIFVFSKLKNACHFSSWLVLVSEVKSRYLPRLVFLTEKKTLFFWNIFFKILHNFHIDLHFCRPKPIYTFCDTAYMFSTRKQIKKNYIYKNTLFTTNTKWHTYI